MEQRTKRLTQVMGAIGIAAGLGLGAAGLASAATSPASTGSGSQSDLTQPSSVQVPDQKETNDATEAAALKAAAKITPGQATQAALAAVPGTVNQVELDNENGSVVYGVEIAANGQTLDVKVDAGTGAVLSQAPSEDGHGETGTEAPGTEKADTGTEKPGTETADAPEPASLQPAG